MKKLLISAFAVVATLVAVDMNAGSCYKNSCRKETNCVKRCEAPAPKICETEIVCDPIPQVTCRKTVEVDAPCSVKEIIHKQYVPFCPTGYYEVGGREEVVPAKRSVKKHDEKTSSRMNKTGRSAKYAAQDIAE